MPPASGNYDVSKGSFGSTLALDPAIAAALGAFLRKDADGAVSSVSVSAPITSELRQANVDGTTVLKPWHQLVADNTDVLTFDLGSGARSIDLSKLDATTLAKLNAVMFTNDDSDPDVDLNLWKFQGVVVLGDGNNNVRGALRTVAIQTGDGNDTITTGIGNDTVVTGKGNDSISTGDGNDLVKAGEGNDTVSTGIGNDTVHTGTGSDSVLLGDGQDLAVIAAVTGDTTTIDGGGDADIVDLTSAKIATVGMITTGPLTGGLRITLDTGAPGAPDAVVYVVNVENFLYDTNGALAGGVSLVGSAQLDAAFPDAP